MYYYTQYAYYFALYPHEIFSVSFKVKWKSLQFGTQSSQSVCACAQNCGSELPEKHASLRSRLKENAVCLVWPSAFNKLCVWAYFKCFCHVKEYHMSIWMHCNESKIYKIQRKLDFRDRRQTQKHCFIFVRVLYLLTLLLDILILSYWQHKRWKVRVDQLTPSHRTVISDKGRWHQWAELN